MKIGYLRLDHGEWTSGAYNSQEIGLAKAYAKLGHDVTIFYCVYDNDPKLGTAVKLSERIRKCYLRAKSFGHHALLNPKELDKYDLDLLHIQGDNLLRVPDVVRYCKMRRLKHYCYVGRIDSEKTGKLHHILANIMVQRNLHVYKNAVVFTKTPAVKKQLDPYNKRGNITIAPVGLDLSIIPRITENKDELREKLNLPPSCKVITCVCGLREGKRPYDIFELAKQVADAYIVFIGGWDERAENAFAQCIKKNRLEERFRYIRKIPNKEIHAYYVASDYVVNFNPNEIFGMAILEAMYQKTTVIARRAPGPEYIIEDGVSGFVVDSIDQMALKINENVCVSEEARKRVLAYFNWDITAQLILDRTRD